MYSICLICRKGSIMSAADEEEDDDEDDANFI